MDSSVAILSFGMIPLRIGSGPPPLNIVHLFPFKPVMRKDSILHILFVVSELEGLVKTGGLADVAKALPIALKQQGHDVRIIMPYHRAIAEYLCPYLEVHSLGVPMGDREIWCSVYSTVLQQIPVYFIDHQFYFFRDRLYDDGKQQYSDNAERFGFFSRAAIQLAKALRYPVDVFHCHDWHTALLPYYLRTAYLGDPDFARTSTVLTIHNGEFQGRFSSHFLPFLGISPTHFYQQFEDHGQVNFLKGGILWSDKIVTVSPGYAEELLTPLGGHGLESVFLSRKSDFSGILNGCDYQTWNPEIDPYIHAKYSEENLAPKRSCKKDLQRCFRLPEHHGVPLIGIVSRLTQQKGFSYTLPAIVHLLANFNVQLIVLGSGESWIENQFHQLTKQFPEKCGFYSGYDESLAHRIEAGSDFFLMPSLYEPCGLNQMYSLRYGTPPIVRKVGGLQDTVVPYDLETGEGTGFVFDLPSTEAVANILQQALRVYHKKPNAFELLRKKGMLERFRWEDAAQQYTAVYRAAQHH